MNSQQFELLLTKLDKLQKDRAREERSNDVSLDKDKKHKKH